MPCCDIRSLTSAATETPPPAHAGRGLWGAMIKKFDLYPLSDGREYGKFQFSPTTIMNLQIEALTGTTYVPSEEPLPRDTCPGELIIEAACRECDRENGEYPTDSTLLRKLRKMDKQKLLLAMHGYFDGEVIVPVSL